jgi:hypothetical protein
MMSQPGCRRRIAPIRAWFEPLEARMLMTRIAVIGDFSSDEQTSPTRDVANLVKSWSPDGIVTVGDNNYPNGAASTIDSNIGQWYHSYIAPYKGSYGAGSSDGQNHFWPALGNHDWYTSGAKPYLNYFTLPGNERYYTTQVGNVGLFVLDSESPEPDGVTATSKQGQWLKTALANSSAKWKLVFFHHPAYSSGGEGSNSYMQWPFAAWGATATFAGHDHDYERILRNGIPYFIDGLGGESIVGFASPVSGSQVRYAGNYGAMKVDASDTSITFQFITRAGSVIDSYTINSSSTVPAAPSDLAATATSASQIQLSWTDNTTNETGYKVERSTDGTNFVEIAPSLGNVTSYTDNGVSAGVKYYYRVRAYNTAGTSGYSNVASATPVNSTSTGVVFISTGSTWKYLDNGSNQGTAWRSRSFSDSAWKSGSAQLGYGDGDEATVVGFGSNASNKYVTTYFRKSISIADRSQVTSLKLGLLRDDGAVVYLNGTEVFRSNMDSGTVAYNTYASEAIEDTSFYSASISPSLLVNGTNVIAVEVHQADPDSSDVSFESQLTGTVMTSTSTQSIAPMQTRSFSIAPLISPTSKNFFDDDALATALL